MLDTRQAGRVPGIRSLAGIDVPMQNCRLIIGTAEDGRQALV